MPSEHEIVRLKKDLGALRALAASLLARQDLDCSENALDLLEKLSAWDREDPPSHRQCETLLSIRDDNRFVSTIRGFSVRTLISDVWQARLDLDEDEDVGFLERLAAERPASVKLRHAQRLLRYATGLGLVHQDA